MGIAGIFKDIGPGQRIALAKVASDHFVQHQRPFRLAIDIAIWLFQIQSGKGGSNPALRTFYYRLLRLLSLNIHPLFVFDGPNKPLFKRNKRVGGPGVKVASVPEFLAKQLLKHFGFPWHCAPGEAEAECALLQREGIVDAVLSEDVDTLMFGSGLTLRNWSSENSSKTPTHVNLYRAQTTLDTSGLDREGMILVALMSGGDYIVEGIPGCGPKVACDAARAGFGEELCAVARRKDAAALKVWRDRLQHEIRTNESKHFTRRNTKLSIPGDFPSREVLGYYTNPCVSTSDVLARLRDELRWDQEIDFAALRTFVADAFDWICLGGAKKFIRNLAPAMLVRRLRFLSDVEESIGEEEQRQKEEGLVKAIVGKRNHNTTDGELEYRICFIPANLVPIDLSIEDPDDDYVPAGGAEDQAELEDEWMTAPGGSQPVTEPASPTKKRNFRPYDPSEPERLWLMRSFLVTGCPLMVELYETASADAREFLKNRRKAKAATTRKAGPKTKKKKNDMPSDALLAFATITKANVGESGPVKPRVRAPLEPKGINVLSSENLAATANATSALDSVFKLPSVQAVLSQYQDRSHAAEVEMTSGTAQERGSHEDRTSQIRPTMNRIESRESAPRTPQHRKRRSPELISPPGTQRTLNSYWSAASRKSCTQQVDVIDLISSPIPDRGSRPVTPSPLADDQQAQAEDADRFDYEPEDLPDTVTKRRKRTPFRRHLSAPIPGDAEQTFIIANPLAEPQALEVIDLSTCDALDLAGPASPETLPSPSIFFNRPVNSEPSDGSATSSHARDHDRGPALSTIGGLDVLDLSHTQEASINAICRVEDALPQMKLARKIIQLRESLPGSWKEIARMNEENSPGARTESKPGRKKVRQPVWSSTNVEILDLTTA